MQKITPVCIHLLFIRSIVVIFFSTKYFIKVCLNICLDPDKNFALEEYGEDSRCFDHTESMWEERTCRQVRQWLHWGSGCYRYKCSSGYLHIIVS